MNMITARHADQLAALGSEPRLEIVRLLLRKLPGELSVSDIGVATGIPGSTLSHHLDRLRREQLVTSRREGKFIYYRAGITAIEALISFLYRDCCGGRNQLDLCDSA